MKLCLSVSAALFEIPCSHAFAPPMNSSPDFITDGGTRFSMFMLKFLNLAVGIRLSPAICAGARLDFPNFLWESV
jgi:hypothetical protein